MWYFDFSYGARAPRLVPVRPLLVVLLTFLTAPPLAAQFHVAAGAGSIPDGDRGPAAEVGIRTALDAGGRVTAGGAVVAGSGGEGFASAAASVELRLDPDALFAPFVGLRAGVLAVPGANRGTVGAVVGLAPRIGPGRRLRLAAGWTRADGGGGPRVLLLGLEFGPP